MLSLSRDLIEGFDKADGGFIPASVLLTPKVFCLPVPSRHHPRPAHYARATLSASFDADHRPLLGLRRNSHRRRQRSATRQPARFRRPLPPRRAIHTDIVAHSVDSFPTRTAEEFLEFLNALLATDPAGPHPNAIEQYLGSHPAALAFVQIPKPIPASFARESFFAVSAFKFTNAQGVSRFGRYRVLPVAGNEYLDEAGAASTDAKLPLRRD